MCGIVGSIVVDEYLEYKFGFKFLFILIEEKNVFSIFLEELESWWKR